MRIAAIDIGTNSIHMVIAQATGRTGFEVVDREREVVQVGSGSFESGRLSADAVRRTVLALRRFAQLARRRQVDKVLCTTTAAVREAENGGEFLRAAREASGVSPRVIPAEEEGRLIHLAVRSSLQLPEAPSLVVDIGGGSMQLALGDARGVHRVASVPLGALRLTETRLAHDPPGPREFARLVRHVRKQVRAAFRTLGDPVPARVYGSSGAIHALAHVARWFERDETVQQLNGHVCTHESITRALRRLMRMPLAQRQRLPELDAKRAEIIVAGTLVLDEVLSRAQVDQITLSDFGLREGLVIDWLDRHAQEVAELEPIADLRQRSAMRLLTKFDGNVPHAQHIVKLSLQLFDGLAEQHGLGLEERELLQSAALLHDVGAAIAYDGHAEHSAYIIRSGGLRGLSDADIEVIAKVAQYHGKGRPRRKDDPRYDRLAKRQRRAVRWLSALLRVAEALDRSHYQLVRGLRVLRRGEGVTLVVDAKRDAQLELWAARRRAVHLARLLGGDVRVVEAARPFRTATEPRPARRTRPAGVSATAH